MSETSHDQLHQPNALPGLVSLVASTGTLLCCALPALLVLVGLGAATASLLGSMPWLVVLSRNKGWVFGFAGILITLNGAYLYWLSPRLAARGTSCDLDEAQACYRAQRLSRRLFALSSLIYAVGVFVAFALGPILEWWSP